MHLKSENSWELALITINILINHVLTYEVIEKKLTHQQIWELSRLLVTLAAAAYSLIYFVVVIPFVHSTSLYANF